MQVAKAERAMFCIAFLLKGAYYEKLFKNIIEK